MNNLSKGGMNQFNTWNVIMKKLLLTILAIATVCTAHGQGQPAVKGSGKISGVVMDGGASCEDGAGIIAAMARDAGWK